MSPQASHTERPPIRVALVEDDVTFQHALKAAIDLAPDMALVGMQSSRSQGLRMLEGPQADVLLVDLGLPDGSGIDVIRAAQQRWPGCNVMVCTVFGDETMVIRSIEAGAKGYLLKDSSAQSMVTEIRNLHAGGSPINPLIARQILQRIAGPAAVAEEMAAPEPAAQKVALSSREREVLDYITKGFTANEIAGLMAVSYNTVQTYVRRIYAKLEVTSKTEAVYEARHQGLLR